VEFKVIEGMLIVNGVRAMVTGGSLKMHPVDEYSEGEEADPGGSCPVVAIDDGGAMDLIDPGSKSTMEEALLKAQSFAKVARIEWCCDPPAGDRAVLRGYQITEQLWKKAVRDGLIQQEPIQPFLDHIKEMIPQVDPDYNPGTSGGPPISRP
jgi:hypothetical protein